MNYLMAINCIHFGISCYLGEYVPLVALLLRAIIKNATKNIPPIMRMPTKIGITTIATSVGVIPVSFSETAYEIYSKNV